MKLLNPAWNSKDLNVDSQFLKAVELTGNELVQRINYVANVWLPARSIVQEAIDKRFEVNKTRTLQFISIYHFVINNCAIRDIVTNHCASSRRHLHRFE